MIEPGVRSLAEIFPTPKNHYLLIFQNSIERSEKMSEQKKDPVQEKKWSTPQLTILVRGYEKESVLFVCKGDGEPRSPNGQWNGCSADFDSPCNSIDRS